MKKYLFLILMAFGCSSAPEPKQPKVVERPVIINWQEFDADLSENINNTGQCAVIYFGTDDCEDCALMEKGFNDPKFVKFINDGFVAGVFPVEEMPETLPGFGIEVLPTLVFLFSEESDIVIQVNGPASTENIMEFIFPAFEAEYNSCKELKR